MARKFKKRPAVKLKPKKVEPVLSVELIRKETLEKVRGFIKSIFVPNKNHEAETNH